MAQFPVNPFSPITNTFGVVDPNAKHGYHAGVDAGVVVGTAVYAPAAGTVTPNIGGTASTNYQGNTIEIYDGKLYPHMFHLSQRLVSPGQRVSEGQLVGYSGNTGLSTGPHVHFGVGKVPYPTSKSINDYIDPMEYIKQGSEEPVSTWNNGQTYNLLYHSISPAVAEQAKAANFVGFFGLQDGWESDKALDAIITSPQYAFMVRDAQAPSEFTPVTEQLYKKG